MSEYEWNPTPDEIFVIAVESALYESKRHEESKRHDYGIGRRELMVLQVLAQLASGEISKPRMVARARQGLYVWKALREQRAKHAS